MSSLLQRMSEFRKNFQERRSPRSGEGNFSKEQSASTGDLIGEYPTASERSPCSSPSAERPDDIVNPILESEDSYSGPSYSSSPKLSRSLPGSLDFFSKRFSIKGTVPSQGKSSPVDIPSSPIDSPSASAPNTPHWGNKKGHVERAANMTKSFRDVWLTPD
eukprot:jgi/Galph1/1954/GphlegSOOS_G663.1